MKDQTKELKPLYREILKKEVWKNDYSDMVDFCMKQVSQIVQLDNGDIIIIEKQSIEKDFCFGYSLSSISNEDYDRANEMARHAKQSEDYFIRENMRDFNRTIEEIDRAFGEDPNTWDGWMYFLVNPYIGQPKESKLKKLYSARISTILTALGGSAYLRELKGTTITTVQFASPLEVGKELYMLNDNDLAVIREGYVRARDAHLKRVQTYLKKYGMKHVNTWSYWQDE